ncbi:hypothetical protein PR048_008488 [Dryococelus australis]|uniref:Uncharacterized protein n=1 Tax=Dryococelus australis TaxID=614101 RepID=A0ABQ9HX94_9NEOP|nr:hypothetical protein PR048_008488 [Dryococelus australis]
MQYCKEVIPDGGKSHLIEDSRVTVELLYNWDHSAADRRRSSTPAHPRAVTMCFVRFHRTREREKERERERERERKRERERIYKSFTIPEVAASDKSYANLIPLNCNSDEVELNFLEGISLKLKTFVVLLHNTLMLQPTEKYVRATKIKATYIDNAPPYSDNCTAELPKEKLNVKFVLRTFRMSQQPIQGHVRTLRRGCELIFTATTVSAGDVTTLAWNSSNRPRQDSDDKRNEIKGATRAFRKNKKGGGGNSRSTTSSGVARYACRARGVALACSSPRETGFIRIAGATVCEVARAPLTIWHSSVERRSQKHLFQSFCKNLFTINFLIFAELKISSVVLRDRTDGPWVGSMDEALDHSTTETTISEYKKRHAHNSSDTSNFNFTVTRFCKTNSIRRLQHVDVEFLWLPSGSIIRSAQWCHHIVLSSELHISRAILVVTVNFIKTKQWHREAFTGQRWLSGNRAGRLPLLGWFFSGIALSPAPFIPGPLHTRLIHPHRLSITRCEEHPNYLLFTKRLPFVQWLSAVSFPHAQSNVTGEVDLFSGFVCSMNSAITPAERLHLTRAANAQRQGNMKRDLIQESRTGERVPRGAECLERFQPDGAKPGKPLRNLFQGYGRLVTRLDEAIRRRNEPSSVVTKKAGVKNAVSAGTWQWPWVHLVDKFRACCMHPECEKACQFVYWPREALEVGLSPDWLLRVKKDLLLLGPPACRAMNGVPSLNCFVEYFKYTVFSTKLITVRPKCWSNLFRSGTAIATKTTEDGYVRESTSTILISLRNHEQGGRAPRLATHFTPTKLYGHSFKSRKYTPHGENTARHAVERHRQAGRSRIFASAAFSSPSLGGSSKPAGVLEETWHHVASSYGCRMTRREVGIGAVGGLRRVSSGPTETRACVTNTATSHWSTLCDTFWSSLAQSSHSNATADNQYTVDIGISVHKTVESSLQPIMNAVKYRVVSGGVWTNRTMFNYNTDTNRTSVLAVVDIARSCALMRVMEVSMELRRNERAGETGDPRENPPTNGIIWHDSHMRKSARFLNTESGNVAEYMYLYPIWRGYFPINEVLSAVGEDEMRAKRSSGGTQVREKRAAPRGMPPASSNARHVIHRKKFRVASSTLLFRKHTKEYSQNILQLCSLKFVTQIPLLLWSYHVTFKHHGPAFGIHLGCDVVKAAKAGKPSIRSRHCSLLIGCRDQVRPLYRSVQHSLTLLLPAYYWLIVERRVSKELSSNLTSRRKEQVMEEQSQRPELNGRPIIPALLWFSERRRPSYRMGKRTEATWRRHGKSTNTEVNNAASVAGDPGISLVHTTAVVNLTVVYTPQVLPFDYRFMRTDTKRSRRQKMRSLLVEVGIRNWACPSRAASRHLKHKRGRERKGYWRGYRSQALPPNTGKINRGMPQFKYNLKTARKDGLAVPTLGSIKIGKWEDKDPHKGSYLPRAEGVASQ